MKCEKCGSTKYIVNHHLKYKEIHGFDKTILLCRSCHKILHNKIRKEGLCGVSPEEINKYSCRASKEFNRKKIKLQRIDFTIGMEADIALHELLEYDYQTGKIIFKSFLMEQMKNRYYLLI